MFSFVKKLEGLLNSLKKKKGLWFSVLSVSAIIGIFLSMYLLTSLTKGVAEEVYINMSNTYKTSLENKLDDKEKDFRRIFIGLDSNKNFQDNVSNVVEVNKITSAYNDMYKKEGFENLTISFYSAINQVNQYRNSINSVITRKSSVYGIEVLTEGVFIVYAKPIIKDDSVLGVLELREPLSALKSEFTKNNGIFLFLMEEKMLANIAINVKNGQYRDVVNDLKVEEMVYDGQFFANIIEDGKDEFKKFKDVGYLVNESYFKTYKTISDVNGASIGYVVLGEKVEGSGAFVNIVDNMTKTVTTVALGLVISILLFMF